MKRWGSGRVPVYPSLLRRSCPQNWRVWIVRNSILESEELAACHSRKQRRGFLSTCAGHHWYFNPWPLLKLGPVSGCELFSVGCNWPVMQCCWSRVDVIWREPLVHFSPLPHWHSRHSAFHTMTITLVPMRPPKSLVHWKAHSRNAIEVLKKKPLALIQNFGKIRCKNWEDIVEK